MSRTLIIVKPDAVERGLAGKIISMAEERGFRIVELKVLRLSPANAQVLYAVHREKPFFGPLTEYMASGPCVACLLEREDAVKAMRELVGQVDPAKSPEGTVRRLYGLDVQRNAVHAPDSVENAQREIGLVFGAAAVA
ncbi:MAG: nucleoside-diphosphate kinase [Candidatus Eisenbacteria bacterium]|nr:nucleoside-diphosphate kinase [Candidatus Eisenbacteria bacterium]